MNLNSGFIEKQSEQTSTVSNIANIKENFAFPSSTVSTSQTIVILGIYFIGVLIEKAANALKDLDRERLKTCAELNIDARIKRKFSFGAYDPITHQIQLPILEEDIETITKKSSTLDEKK